MSPVDLHPLLTLTLPLWQHSEGVTSPCEPSLSCHPGSPRFRVSCHPRPAPPPDPPSPLQAEVQRVQLQQAVHKMEMALEDPVKGGEVGE